MAWWSNRAAIAGYGRPFKVAHGRDEFVRGAVHINSIEGFWGFAKNRLAKFRGMNKKPFFLWELCSTVRTRTLRYPFDASHARFYYSCHLHAQPGTSPRFAHRFSETPGFVLTGNHADSAT